MAVCRACGAGCAPGEVLPVQRGGGCVHCNGSPVCTRCGHPRRRHRGTFGGGRAGCEAQVAAAAGLAVGRCGCAEYTTDPAAFGTPIEIVDLVELRLRGPSEARCPEPPQLAPARDLFDEGRRLRDLGEAQPWRPFE